MKKLTILIFSGNRLTIKGLLDDIIKLKDFDFNIRIIDWSDNKKTKKKKNKIYKIYKKKFLNLKVFYDQGNWEYKYKKYIISLNQIYFINR